MNNADLERRLQDEYEKRGLLMAENQRLRQRCAFPSCVNGEKPPWCGNCGDAVRADAAEAANERLRYALRPYVWHHDAIAKGTSGQIAVCRCAMCALARAALGERP